MRKLFLTLAGLALIASPAFAGKYNKVVSVGEKAPTFSGIPADHWRTGRQPEPRRHQGRRGRSGLPRQPLPQSWPHEDRIIDFANDYKGKSVKVVAVSVNDMDSDRLPAIKEHVKKKGVNYVYGYDETQEIGRAYGATNTPQFFVLDKDRVIRYMGADGRQPATSPRSRRHTSATRSTPSSRARPPR